MVYRVLIIVLLAGILNSCKKDKKTQQGVPNVHVDVYMYSTDPNFVPLTVVGGWVYLNGGSRGLIVFRASNSDFVSYDRHCPYDPENECGIVDVDNSNVWAVDSCCSSKFLLLDGSVANGPATFPLKKYNTTFDGNILHIYNQ